MDAKKKLLWALVWVMPMGVLIVAILAGKHRLGNGTNYYPPPAHVKKLIDSWRAQTFVKIEPASEANLQDLAGALNFSFPAAMQTDEKAELTNSVVGLLRSFSAGTFDSYTQFRFPTKDFYYSKNFSNFLGKSLSLSAQMIHDNPDKVWKIYWDAKIKDRFTNYWIGLSPEKSSALVSQVNIFTNSLDQLVKQADNVGILKVVPCASFSTSPSQILAKYGSLDVATVHILPQTRDNDAIYPVYVRWYWSPPDNIWLPEGLVCAYSRPERKMSLIF